MTEHDNEIEKLLRRYRPVGPPQHLRERALGNGSAPRLSFLRRSMVALSVRSRVVAAAAAALIVGAVGGFLLRGLLSSEPKPSAALVAIRLVDVKGTVLINHPWSESWQEAGVGNTRLFVGDTLLSSSNASAALLLEDDSRVVLAGNSVLSLRHHDGATEFWLARGTVRAELRSPHPPFGVLTPQGQVQALGTEFTVTVE